VVTPLGSGDGRPYGGGTLAQGGNCHCVPVVLGLHLLTLGNLLMMLFRTKANPRHCCGLFTNSRW